MNGKGSKRRPRTISRAEEQLRWDAIFGKKPELINVGNIVKLASTGLVGEVVKADHSDILPFKVKFDCFTSYYEEKDIKLIKPEDFTAFPNKGILQ